MVYHHVPGAPSKSMGMLGKQYGNPIFRHTQNWFFTPHGMDYCPAFPASAINFLGRLWLMAHFLESLMNLTPKTMVKSANWLWMIVCFLFLFGGYQVESTNQLHHLRQNHPWNCPVTLGISQLSMLISGLPTYLPNKSCNRFSNQLWFFCPARCKPIDVPFPPLLLIISMLFLCADVWNYKKPEWGTSDVRDRGNEQSAFQGWGGSTQDSALPPFGWPLGAYFRLFQWGTQSWQLSKRPGRYLEGLNRMLMG